MSRFRVRDLWCAVSRLSKSSGEHSSPSRSLYVNFSNSNNAATFASRSNLGGVHADGSIRQLGLAFLNDCDRINSAECKMGRMVDGSVLLADFRCNASIFNSSGILAGSPFSDQLYRPSGVSTLLNTSTTIFDKQLSGREKQSGVRGFAKTVQVPQTMQKPMKLKLYMGSPGVIGEPYKLPPSPLPFFQRWFTKEGWARKKQSFMGMIKTSYTVAKLRQKTKGYSQQRFYQEVSDLYKQINSALADGERTSLRHVVTDSVFSIMKNELKHRENSPWAKVEWEMVGPVTKMRTLQGRLIGVDKNNHDNAFVQLTVKINSKQKFAAYDKRGKLVAGDPEKELLVEDIWVFEKPLLLTEAKWRLCARLSV